MTIKEQVDFMEKQLSLFDTLLHKTQYLTEFFDPDPEFSQEARDIVRSNLAAEERDRRQQQNSKEN